MGKVDAESKKYVNNPEIFADIFNYFLFDGEQVIKPDELQTVDTDLIALPYGNNARMPVQKYRDSFKVWKVMEDKDNTYVLLGQELESKINYAMPVKDNLYDALGYAEQVDAANSSYHKKNGKKDAEIVLDGATVKIRLTQDEFLSGFRKDDKLMPVITVVVYFGSREWDGPRSLYDMLDYKDKRILKAIPNYWINLIAPAEIPDEDFDAKFSTDLGVVFNVLKHSEGNVVDFLQHTRKRFVDKRTAEFMRDGLDLPIAFEEKEAEEEGGVNLSKATQDYLLEKEVRAAVGAYQDVGLSERDIVKRIMDKYGVSEEYVLNILHPAA